MRIWYRARQFWYALTAVLDPDDLNLARRALTSPLLALFLRMQPSEQAHSLWILRQLHEQGETHNDLMVAALLHDVGKSCYPLSLWERIVIVMGKAFFPERVKHWGQGEVRGWKRPFVIAEQHPIWGAEMAAQAGASPLTVSLIRRHQDNSKQVSANRGPMQSKKTEHGLAEKTRVGFISLEDQLLYRLQSLDDES